MNEFEHGLDEFTLQAKLPGFSHVVLQKVLPSGNLKNRDIVLLLEFTYFIDPLHPSRKVLYDL